MVETGTRHPGEGMVGRVSRVAIPSPCLVTGTSFMDPHGVVVTLLRNLSLLPWG